MTRSSWLSGLARLGVRLACDRLGTGHWLRGGGGGTKRKGGGGNVRFYPYKRKKKGCGCVWVCRNSLSHADSVCVWGGGGGVKVVLTHELEVLAILKGGGHKQFPPFKREGENKS